MGNWEFCSHGCRVDFKQQMASRDDLMGPWRLEYRQASKILPISHDRYERSIVKYLDYLKRNKCNPDTWEEHEDLVAKYKTEENITNVLASSLLSGRKDHLVEAVNRRRRLRRRTRAARSAGDQLGPEVKEVVWARGSGLRCDAYSIWWFPTA